MNLLALDPATVTGWCAGSKASTLTSGTWDLRPSRFDSMGMKFVLLRKRLTETCEGPLDLVVYEEVRRHRGTDQAHSYGGLVATIQAFCVDRGVPYKGVPVGTIKKFATGKGNADKPAMIAAAQAWGHRPADDNEADAIALCRWALAEYGERSAAPHVDLSDFL